MNYIPFILNFTHNTKISRNARIGNFFTIVLAALLGSFFCISSAQADQSPPITIVDTWVEDGFLFHVAFESQPANVHCELNGEGLIEFEVVYGAQTSNRVESVFGVAPWSSNSNTDITSKTQGQAIGPQALCTKFTPCRIQNISIVKAWCPVTNDPLFSW